MNPHFESAVETIYTAATDIAVWPDALQTIADSIGGVGANFFWRKDDGSFGIIGSPGLDPRGVAEYQQGWWKHDIRGQRAVERSYLVSGDVTTDRHLVTNEEIESHPYFTQFLAKFGLKWIAAVGLSPDSHIDVAISVQGATSRGPFSDRELEVLGALGAHAERSLRLSVRIFDQQLARATLQQALERLNIGVFALDSNCRVLFSNSAAEGMMGDGVAVLNRKLVLRPMNEDVGALDNAVRSLATDKRAPKPIMVRGPNPGRLLACYVLPSLKGSTQPFIGSRVFVLLVDSRPGDRPDPAILRDLLDLTLGEARVAAVVGLGISPREAAAKLGLTEETVRTALKRVFSKAGVSSQSELTALLTRLILR